MLALDNYCDSSTQEGVEQSSFIGQYARFLSQKLDMYNELNYVLERRFKDNSSSAMEWIGSLPLTVRGNVLCQCESASMLYTGDSKNVRAGVHCHGKTDGLRSLRHV